MKSMTIPINQFKSLCITFLKTQINPMLVQGSRGRGDKPCGNGSAFNQVVKMLVKMLVTMTVMEVVMKILMTVLVSMRSQK